MSIIEITTGITTETIGEIITITTKMTFLIEVIITNSIDKIITILIKTTITIPIETTITILIETSKEASDYEYPFPS